MGRLSDPDVLILIAVVVIAIVIFGFFAMYERVNTEYIVVIRHTPNGNVSTTYSGYKHSDISWEYNVLSLDYGRDTCYHEIKGCDVKVYNEGCGYLKRK